VNYRTLERYCQYHFISFNLPKNTIQVQFLEDAIARSVKIIESGGQSSGNEMGNLDFFGGMQKTRRCRST
jgi:hypothetical protein